MLGSATSRGLVVLFVSLALRMGPGMVSLTLLTIDLLKAACFLALNTYSIVY